MSDSANTPSFTFEIHNNGLIHAEDGDRKVTLGQLVMNKVKVNELVAKIEARDQSQQIFQDLGKILFDSLITHKKFNQSDESDISIEFGNWWDKFEKERNHSRITLRIQPGYFQTLPWELLCRDLTYLSSQMKISIVRQPFRVSEVKSKSFKKELNMLIILSDPIRSQHLSDAKSEKDAIGIILENVKDNVKIRPRILSTDSDLSSEIPTLPNITKALDDTQFNIVHYIGHSDFVDKDDAGEGNSRREREFRVLLGCNIRFMIQQALR